MNTVLKRKWQAFSLPELLVVLVIIGILVLIALPNLMPLISKAKSMEAQQQLGFPAYAGKELFLYPVALFRFVGRSRFRACPLGDGRRKCQLPH